MLINAYRLTVHLVCQFRSHSWSDNIGVRVALLWLEMDVLDCFHPSGLRLDLPSLYARDLWAGFAETQCNWKGGYSYEEHCQRRSDRQATFGYAALRTHYHLHVDIHRAGLRPCLLLLSGLSNNF